MKALEVQHGGRHYRDMKIQPVEFILSNALGFCEGSVVKYVSRWRNKGGIEDLRKAKHFTEIMLESPDYYALLMKLRPSVVPQAGEAPLIGPGAYCEANGIADLEEQVIRSIWIWNVTPDTGHLIYALSCMEELIASALEEGQPIGG